MNSFFEAKLKYLKVAESGAERMLTENFLLDAVSFTDAESRMTKQGQEMVRGGEFSVKDIKQSNISEVFPYENGEWWYKAKVNLVTVDEQAGREKRVSIYHLVMADDPKEALHRLDESLSYLVIPYEVLSVAKSNICDVFPYDYDAAAAEMQKSGTSN